MVIKCKSPAFRGVVISLAFAILAASGIACLLIDRQLCKDVYDSKMDDLPDIGRFNQSLSDIEGYNKSLSDIERYSILTNLTNDPHSMNCSTSITPKTFRVTQCLFIRPPAVFILLIIICMVLLFVTVLTAGHFYFRYQEEIMAEINSVCRGRIPSLTDVFDNIDISEDGNPV